MQTWAHADRARTALVTLLLQLRQYWGGGVFCADNYEHLPKPTAGCLIPAANGTMVTAPCFNAEVAPMCTNNGDVKLPYGSGPYVGLGLLVRGWVLSRLLPRCCQAARLLANCCQGGEPHRNPLPGCRFSASS